jgi:hypothetical protein
MGGVFDSLEEGLTMTYTRISGRLSRVITSSSSRVIALTMIVTFASLAVQPAHAQSADTWKSAAIIGGSTATGAYIGHKVGGGKGALIGAGAGASAGYVIDRRRRANEYYNQSSYESTGYSGPTGGYNGNDGAAVPALQYRNNNYSGNIDRQGDSQSRSR